MSNPTGKHTGKQEALELMRWRRKVNDRLQSHHGFKVPVSSAYLVNSVDQARRDGLTIEQAAERIDALSWGKPEPVLTQPALKP